MKKSLLALGSVLFLAACSGGGDGKGGLAPAPNSDIDPLARPSNPAPMAYIQSIYKLVQNSSKYIPQDAALFSEVFYGDYVSKIEEGSESHKQAMARLNEEGLRFRDRIKANCVLSGVAVVESSKASVPAKKGEVSTKKLSQSSLGSRCEYILNKAAEVTKTYLEDEAYDAETRTSTFKTSIIEVESESAEIRNDQIVAAAGTKSTKSTTTRESQSEGSYAPKSSTHKNSSKSTGTFESVLSNGHVIKGTIQRYSISTQSRDENGKDLYVSESVSQAKASTPRGELWVTYVSKNGVGEIYVNGQKLSPEEAEKIGLGIRE